MVAAKTFYSSSLKKVSSSKCDLATYFFYSTEKATDYYKL
ncbi:hypothetical protein AsAng_0014960 [Aureispira anguillae]|uniref:Uncharacterized protein n=1 Tax=Aureispira anguillae TaxID=2864201 RepID=A0A915YCX5_9BACT|nr:hypothetical protein AsAng_0014960 [Aureispira anguillae]